MSSSVIRLPDLAAGKVEVAPVDQEVLFHGQLGVEVVLLGDDSEPGPDGRTIDLGVEVEYPEMARGDRGNGGDHPHRRGLAGAIGAEKTERLALGDLEGDAVDGHHLAEVFREVSGLDQCSAHSRGTVVSAGRKTASRKTQADARRQDARMTR